MASTTASRYLPTTRPLPARSTARFLAIAAGTVGLGYAAVSLYWGFGGTALLDTVGGSLAAGGRAGSAIVVTGLWVAVLLKLTAVALPFLVAWRRPGARHQWAVRAWTWFETVVVTGYGLLFTAVGLLVQLDVVHAAAGADRRALAWHTFVWDPWFLCWGLLVGGVLLTTCQDRRSSEKGQP